MIYLIVIAFVAAAGWFGYEGIQHGAIAKYQQQVDAQDNALKAQAATIEKEVADHENYANAAYEQGLQDGAEASSKASARIRADVAATPSLASSACTLPPASYALLTAALRSVRGDAIPEELLSAPTTSNVPAVVIAPAARSSTPTTSTAPTAGTPSAHPKPRPLAR